MKPCVSLAAAALLAAALAGCTASVTHPTKSASEMQADIDECTSRANRRYWMDPVAALYRAYDCLEDRGYQRNEHDVSARVERAMGERGPPPPEGPRAPCRVPCRRD